MSISLKNSFAALTLATSSLIFTSGVAIAQQAPTELDETITIFEAVENEYFSHDRDFYRNRSLIRQVEWVFGLSYPENEIYRDGREINEIYNELLDAQVSTTPLIRTPDLVNPYDTSLLSMPPEVEEERDVRRDPIPPVPLPVQQQPAPPQPVPALW